MNFSVGQNLSMEQNLQGRAGSGTARFAHELVYQQTSTSCFHIDKLTSLYL